MKFILLLTICTSLILENLCFSQSQNLKFRHLTTNQGLSQSHVTSILKDKRGFMWFGTEDGLNKYDGYRYTHYKHDQDDPSSIADSYIKDMLEDRSGNLWIATSNGFDKFDREKNIFIHYRKGNPANEFNDIFLDREDRIWVGTNKGLFLFNPLTGSFKSYQYIGEKSNAVLSRYVSQISQDNQGRLWIGSDFGLYRLEIASGKYEAYFYSPTDKKSVSTNWIKTIFKDARGNLWIGTHGGGLLLYDSVNDSFKRLLHDPKNPNSLAHNDILSLSDGVDGKLWIGTENGGISIYDLASNRFKNFKNNENDNSTISNNSVYCIYQDQVNNMWFGTYAGGVDFLPRFADKFISYHQVVNDENSLSNNNILCISGDGTDSNVWIGTDGGGLNLFDRKTKTFKHFRNIKGNANSISNDYVISIIAMSKDVLGLAYHNGGFDLFNTHTGKFKHHLPEAGNPNSLSISDINNLYKDRDGNVWLGTWKGGLAFYDSKTGKFTSYRYRAGDSTSISNDIVTSVFQDKKGNMWIGTFDGLNLLDPKTKRFKQFKNDINNKKSISKNYVQSFSETDNGDLWIGTVGGGLNYFDVKKQTFKTYRERDGLASNVVFGILEDRCKNLWLSTNRGISYFDIPTNTFRNFGISDGLQGNEFRDNACYLAPDGQMFFGGINGFSTFYPDSLRNNNFIPPVFITDFLLFNKEVAIGGKEAILQQHISETKTLTLAYDQSVFTFEFAALNFTAPEKNQYAYMLEGFNKNWTFVGNNRSATYTNLDPGTYTFRVKASNNDGIWNEIGTSLKIIITPPFWLTWWFKLTVILILSGLVILLYKIRTYAIRKQKRGLERQVAQRTKQLQLSIEEKKKAVEIADMANRAKSAFLATMSHEIRTPMNGVIGLAALLAETDLNEEQKNFTKSIQASGADLLEVINDILDFSKIESDNMELLEVDCDLRECIQNVFDLFTYRNTQVKLLLKYTIDQQVPFRVIADGLRLRQILTNLVGNAIKFTKQGEVSLHVSVIKRLAENGLLLGFDVKDTGIGIAEDKMERLFKAFSQVDSSTARQYGGSGLGLAISQKLAKLMGGTISVESRIGEGSTFRLSIRVKKSAHDEPRYADYNFTQQGNYGMPVTEQMSQETSTNPTKVLKSLFSEKFPLSILVAEDNKVNQIVILNILNKLGYKADLVEDGLEAFNSIKQKQFDIVLMDVQMPKMDGLKATKLIKELLPERPYIIALTANAMEQDKEKCLEAGMDDFISKPIQIQELLHILEKWALRSGIRAI